MLLDASSCQSFCASLGETFGPRAIEWLALVGAMVLGWWKARQVKAAAQASVQQAHEQAAKAKTETRALRLEVAEIRGSIRTPSIPAAAPPIIIQPDTTTTTTDGPMEREP